jgi:hypothetical protein
VTSVRMNGFEGTRESSARRSWRTSSFGWDVEATASSCVVVWS